MNDSFDPFYRVSMNSLSFSIDNIKNLPFPMSVFEDNQSACYLATIQRITNQTKRCLCKFHWFWVLYNKKVLQIVKYPTDASMLTKSTCLWIRISSVRNTSMVVTSTHIISNIYRNLKIMTCTVLYQYSIVLYLHFRHNVFLREPLPLTML